MFERLGTFLRNDAIRRTFGYYSLFICVGLSSAITGPTLPALASHTHTGVGNVGLIFHTGAMIYLVFGSLVMNLLAFTGMLRLRPAKTPSMR